MMLLDGVIVELVAKGMIMAAGFVYDDAKEAVKATQEQLEKMTGVLEKLRLQNKEELTDLGQKLDEVHNSILDSELSQLRDQMLQAMSNEVDDAAVRRRIVMIAMILYCLVRKTSVEQVALKVQKVVALPSSSSLRREIVESELVTVGGTTTVDEIVSNLLQMKGIFSSIEHSTENQLSINVDAAARVGSGREDLIKATGGLFKLCQALCNVVQDERGAYAVSKGDSFARSDKEPQHNACLIGLHYYWPSPIEFREHEDFVVQAAIALKEESDVEDPSFDEFTEAFKKKKVELSVKNVYLLGLTGEGKSTLGNKLTGTQNFHVSDAGTGTERISGALAAGGVLGSDSNVMVWDTPGMDDEQGRDRIYESMLYQHLTRENTVSTIIIVSKDGSRFPKSLKRTIDVYQEAFGDAFLSCVCKNFLGNKADENVHFSEEAVRRKVFFYDARTAVAQPDAGRLKAFILSGKPYLTGTGVAILHGLQRLRSAQLQDEEKRIMVRGSKEMFRALRSELQNFQRVRMRFTRSQGLTEKMTLHLLPNVEDKIVGFFRKHKQKKEVAFRKVIEIVAKGRRAKELLSFSYLSHSEMGCHMKIKILSNYVDTWDLILANMGSTPMDTGWGMIQLQTYNLIYLNDQLDKAVFDAVDKLLDK
ncbi:50S ribosome-binding GTPase [Gracilaria domingensis]|nr:50S ribosome-binding GTPase [Gracilaria domingensis]